MTSIELQAKFDAAELKVEKIKGTIKKHETRAAKHLANITANGWTLNRYDYTGSSNKNSDAYWAICDYESALEDVKGATRKLEDAKATAANWKVRLQQAVALEAIHNDLPEVFKALQNELVTQWDEWDIKRRDRIYNEYKEQGYKEFNKKHTRADYEFMYKDDEQIHKDNERCAKDLVIDLHTRVIAITGEVTNWMHITFSGGALNGRVDGVKGSARVESILAGGYNIQRLHVRVLVHKIG